MDVLRKELDAIYTAQGLGGEVLDVGEPERLACVVADMTAISGACAVITDVSGDVSCFFGGSFARLLGVDTGGSGRIDIASSDEDFIYERMHPEDLVDKRMLEYEFFRFIDRLPPERKLGYKAVCGIRMRDCNGEYIRVNNTTQVLRLSPAGMMWLVLCCYDLSAEPTEQAGIGGSIINSATGEIVSLSFSDSRANILSVREKQVLRLIKSGRLSKEIACDLGISVNTVNRHRQNILRKLSVGNSLEAVRAAEAMKII